jgi:hypothetical protein
MNTCNKCGIGNRDEAKFCSSCGTSLFELDSDDPAYQKLHTSKENVVLSVLWDVFWSGVVMYPFFVAYRMVQPGISSDGWIFPWMAVSFVLAIAGIFEIQNSYIELSKNGISMHYRFKGVKSIEWKDIKFVGDIDYRSSFFDWIFSRPQIDSKNRVISYQARNFLRSDQLKVCNYIKEYAPQVRIENPLFGAGEVWWWTEVSRDFYGIRPLFRRAFSIVTLLLLVISHIYWLHPAAGATRPWATEDNPVFQWVALNLVAMIFVNEYRRWGRRKKKNDFDEVGR